MLRGPTFLHTAPLHTPRAGEGRLGIAPESRRGGRKQQAMDADAAAAEDKLRTVSCSLPTLVATVPGAKEGRGLATGIAGAGGLALHGSIEASRSGRQWAQVLFGFPGVRVLVRWVAEEPLLSAAAAAGWAPSELTAALDDAPGLRFAFVTMDADRLEERWRKSLGSAGVGVERTGPRYDKEALGLVTLRRAAKAGPGAGPDAGKRSRARRARVLSVRVADGTSGVTVSGHQCGVGSALPLVARMPSVLPAASELAAAALEATPAGDVGDTGAGVGGGGTVAATADAAAAEEPADDPAGLAGAGTDAAVSAAVLSSVPLPRPAGGSGAPPLFGLLLPAERPKHAAQAWADLLGRETFSVDKGARSKPFGWPVAASTSLVIAFSDAPGARPTLLFMPPRGSLAGATTALGSAGWVTAGDSTVRSGVAGVRAMAQPGGGPLQAGLLFARSPGMFGRPDDTPMQRLGLWCSTVVALVAVASGVLFAARTDTWAAAAES